MPCIKKQPVHLTCGHTMYVPHTVVKYITEDTECVDCIKKSSTTWYGKNKTV